MAKMSPLRISHLANISARDGDLLKALKSLISPKTAIAEVKSDFRVN
jgi:hypothetical protein